MHHDASFLQDLALVMCVAAVATVLFRQFKQPVVLGYILAGVIVGPHVPFFVTITDEKTIETLAELGIIFLMFALGLEFSLRKLQQVGATAFIAAAMEIILMVLVGYWLGRAFGWSVMDSVFLGAILSISSTTIIIKALEGLGKTKERFASLIFGILIVEDILAIIMLALLSGFARSGELEAGEVGMTILSLGSFLVILLVVGLILVPRLLNYVAKFKSDEMLLITVLGLCFGVSLITVKLEYSVALGAFLIGAIIAEARQIARIETLMHPVRDMFSAVFFVSIGLLIDPMIIWKYIGPILIISAVVVVGKVFTCALGTFVAGNDTRTSLRVGMGLAQIGEFSFIIASLGLTYGVTSDFIYPIAVAVSAITTLLTPYLIRSSDGVVAWFDRVAPQSVLRGLEAYSEWVGGVGRQNAANLERKIITKLALQVGVNLFLVTGIFIGAIFLYRQLSVAWPDYYGGTNGLKATIWMVAMLVSFPLLVAIWRKMEVGAMMFSELCVSSEKAGSKAPAIRAIVSAVVTVVGTGGLIVVLLLLSSALLPTWNVLLLVGLIVAVCGFLLYRVAVKLYARAQSALHDTFAQPADPHVEPHGRPLPQILKEAQLETVEVGAAVVGRKISELRLRSEAGASIVGIDRRGKSIVNPGAGEELQTGDRILLLGDPGQLEAARKLLTAK